VRASTSPEHRLPSLGLGQTWRSLGRSLPANFIACSARLAAGGWVAAAASRSVLTSTSLQ